MDDKYHKGYRVRVRSLPQRQALAHRGHYPGDARRHGLRADAPEPADPLGGHDGNRGG